MTIACLLAWWICANPAGAAQAVHPLAPPDTSSPRATLSTFLDEMNKAVDAYKSGNRDQASDFLNRAGRCLDLDAEPPAIRPVLGMYAALYLKETLDRIDFPPLEDIPDAKAVEARKLTAWILPFTEITIAAGKDGPTGGKFLFSPDTVNRSEEFYDKVRLFPYKPGAEGALFDQLTLRRGRSAQKKS